MGEFTDLTEVNTITAIVDSEVSSADVNNSDEGIMSHKQLGTSNDGPASRIWKVFALTVSTVWGAIRNNFRVLYIDHVPLDPTRNTTVKGFAPNSYAAGDRKKTASKTHSKKISIDEITTDYGTLLRDARSKALSLNNYRDSTFYRACHQKFAQLSQAAYETRFRPPKVIGNIKRSWFSLPGQRSSHSSKPDGHQIWAVLIGIDGYENPLYGCVADAQAFEHYLTSVLRIPLDRIQHLLGKNIHDVSIHTPTNNSLPTRANIVDTLLELSTNQKIKKGDSIIIYFSGHGSSYHCPECYRTILPSYAPDSSAVSALANECCRHLCPIEALCPIDRGIPDAQGTCVPDISDREINNILAHIHSAKDARITVILDCCHAGGTTRAPSGGYPRTAKSLPYGSFVRMLNSAKERMGHWDGYQNVWAEDWKPDEDCHVVFTACKDYEFAKEWQGESGYGGVFTQALVRALTSGSLPKEATYWDLLEALPILSGQTPLLAGRRVHEPLWL